MVMLKSCCCCFRLKTGGLILGWLGVIAGIYGFLEWGMIALRQPDNVKVSDEKLNDTNANWPMKASDETFDNEIILPISSYAICMITSISLIVGINKAQHQYLIPWLIVNFIGLVILGILMILCIIASVTEPLFIIFLVIGGLYGALEIHFFLVIFSLYKVIRAGGYMQRGLMSQDSVEYSKMEA